MSKNMSKNMSEDFDQNSQRLAKVMDNDRKLREAISKASNDPLYGARFRKMLEQSNRNNFINK